VAITVSWTSFYTEADFSLGARLRILSVANEASYPDVTTPQVNFTAGIVWSRANSLTAYSFSAACYFFGVEAATAHPDIPFGMISSAWGGVSLETFASPAALAQCNVSGSSSPQQSAIVAAATLPGATLTAGPVKPSCLYNSMIAPILSIPIKVILWYQVRYFKRRHPHFL
jgi:hypothetical protein